MTGVLYTFSVFHPGYRNIVTIDAWAENQAAALRSLRRFVDRENRRLRRAGLPRARRLRRPSALTIVMERPARAVARSAPP